MATVGLPLTGAGGTTVDVATDLIGGAHYQAIKLFDGTSGSTLPIAALATTPASSDPGMIVRPIGSTAFRQAVALTSGSTGIMGAFQLATGTTGSIGQVGLTSEGSTRLAGLTDGIPFSSAGTARTTANSSADVSLLAANANRRGAIIQNLATGAELWLGLSTGAVSTALANVQIKIPANGYVTFGGQLGNFPNYTGPIRGRVGSTTIAGPVAITEFS